MTQRLYSPRWVLGGLLLATCLSASAVSLGRLRGAVLIGQPLDVTVAVELQAEDNLTPSCFSVDVLHGDTRIGESQINLTVLPGATPTSGSLRIRSSAIVDEPIVTLFVKVACAQDITRRYVVLPDVTPDYGQAPASPVPALPRVDPSAFATPGAGAPPTAAPAPAPAPVPRPAANSSTSSTPAPAAATAPRPERATAQTPTQPRPRPPARVTPPTASGAATNTRPGPRLRLEPAELPPAATATTRTPPAASTAAPSTTNAGSALPSNTTVNPGSVGPQLPGPNTGELSVVRTLDAVLADEQRLRTMEAELKSLLEISKANQASMELLQARLERADQERYSNPLVYGLIVALLAALMAAFYMWQRQRRMEAEADQRWADMQLAAADRTPSAAMPLTASTLVMPSAPAPLASVQAPAPTPEPARAPTAWSRPAPLAEASGPDFSNSGMGGMRSVSTEELFDIQQQADFFVVLGQHDQAVSLLQTHISENPQTSALAYLDLLSIYHQLGRRVAFDELRDRFNLNFNAQVPEFDAFAQKGRTLEDYPAVLAQISALWPRPDVLHVIEDLVFRQPGQGGSDSFDMEAYRDLMLLYSVGRLVVLWNNPSRQSVDQEPTRLQSNFGEMIEPSAPLMPNVRKADDMDYSLDLDLGQGPPVNPDDTPTLPPTLQDEDLMRALEDPGLTFPGELKR